MIIFWVLLGINALLSLAFILTTKQKDDRIFGLMFMLVPFLGFAIYFIPFFLHKLTKKHNIYDKANVIMQIENEDLSQKPSLEDEMNVVALNAAMTACTAQERRALLLNVMKNDMVKNASIIKIALTDSDSETSHYAASATTETYKKLKAAIQELEVSIIKNQDDPKTIRELIDLYFECISNGVLNKRDYLLFISKFVKLMEYASKSFADVLDVDDYINQADCYLKLKRNYDAISVINFAIEKFQTESAYFKALEIHFQMKNQKCFDELFSQLKKSDIVLSHKTIELIRFWNTRCV